MRDGSVIEVQVAHSTTPPARTGQPDPDLDLLKTAMAELAHRVGAVTDPSDDAGPEFPRRLEPRQLTDLLPHEGAAQVKRWVEAAFARGAKTEGYYRVADEGDIERTFHVTVLPGEADGLVTIRDVTVSDPSTALELAVDRGDLSFRMRPRVDGAGRVVMGRSELFWLHPEIGDVPVDPSERTPNLRDRLDDWVIHAAVRHVASATNVGVPLGAAVEVSRQWLERGDHAAVLAGLIECYGAEPSLLEVTVDYDEWMIDPDVVSQGWAPLSELGCKVSVIGVGRHTLDLVDLEQLRTDRWILDPRRVIRAGRSPVDAAALESIVVLARGLGVEAVADGVDGEAQKERLWSIGCTMFEGPAFGPPRDGYELLRQVRRRMRQQGL